MTAAARKVLPKKNTKMLTSSSTNNKRSVLMLMGSSVAMQLPCGLLKHFVQGGLPYLDLSFPPSFYSGRRLTTAELWEPPQVYIFNK